MCRVGGYDEALISRVVGLLILVLVGKGVRRSREEVVVEMAMVVGD